MFQVRKVLLLLLPLIFAMKTFAYTPKEGNVSAVLGPFTYKTNFNGSDNGLTSPYLNGVALMAIGDISDRGSLEIAMIHMNKIFFRDQNSKFIAEKTQMMHVTMGYRRWLSSVFSTSLTFFSAYPMGDTAIIHSDFTPKDFIDTSARDVVEYGFDFALQAELWSSGKYAVVMDTRYSRSLTPRQDEKGDHYGVLLGLRYFIKEKEIKEKPKEDGK